MIRKRLIVSSYIFYLTLLFSTVAFTQQASLDLQGCYTLARQNYPLIQRQELIKQAGAYSVENIRSGYLPGITINGQFTYQSDVTKVPINNPGMEIPVLSKDQYKVYAELTQVIYDGGMISNQRQAREAQTSIEQQSLEVELYKLYERVNQVYFGVLLLEGQLAQTALLKSDIQAGLAKTEASYANGVVLKSSVDVLKAEHLKINQRLIELNSAKVTYMQMLGLLINMQVTDSTRLEMPPAISIATDIRRPELGLFEAQYTGMAIQARAIDARNMPRVNAFVQGGYGLPALNMLDPDADTYYMAGVRFAFPLTGFYNKKREKSINLIERQSIDVQRETFLFNTNIQTSQQAQEISKIQQLIESDQQILTLREDIKRASMAQLENGVITSADYLREVNAEDNARQAKLIHEIQLLLTQYNHQLTTGK